MKRHFLILFATAVFVTTLTTTAFGQTGKAVTVNVKFDFRIGDRIYPAGEYRIESVSSQADNVLLIRNVGDPNRTQLILAIHLDAGKERAPKLVFLKDGESYFLMQIFLDSERWGYSIRPSRRQRASEKDLALASLELIEVR